MLEAVSPCAPPSRLAAGWPRGISALWAALPSHAGEPTRRPASIELQTKASWCLPFFSFSFSFWSRSQSAAASASRRSNRNSSRLSLTHFLSSGHSRISASWDTSSVSFDFESSTARSSSSPLGDVPSPLLVNRRESVRIFKTLSVASLPELRAISSALFTRRLVSSALSPNWVKDEENLASQWTILWFQLHVQDTVGVIPQGAAQPPDLACRRRA